MNLQHVSQSQFEMKLRILWKAFSLIKKIRWSSNGQNNKGCFYVWNHCRQFSSWWAFVFLRLLSDYCSFCSKFHNLSKKIVAIRREKDRKKFWSRNYFSKRFRKVVKSHFKLGTDYGLYGFRHTYITKLYRAFENESSPFEAKSKRGGKARKMKEVSRFEKLDGRWFYVSGDYSASWGKNSTSHSTPAGSWNSAFGSNNRTPNVPLAASTTLSTIVTSAS